MLEQLPERLSSKIAIEDESGCWLWLASLRDGYGQVRSGSTVRSAHVVVYELLVGAVDVGMELDHLCRVRHCVNPVHLEQVVHRTNVLRGDAAAASNARKTHCVRGHELIDANVYVYGRHRTCKQCLRVRNAMYRSAKVI